MNIDWGGILRRLRSWVARLRNMHGSRPDENFGEVPDQLTRMLSPGTIDGGWRPSEIEHIMATGKLPNYVVGHHINSAAAYPDWAGDPRNIEFVRGRKAHLTRHRGDWCNSTMGPLIDREAMLKD